VLCLVSKKERENYIDLIIIIIIIIINLFLTEIGLEAVQYTFTHKQYTEYRERNIHNNKKSLGSAGRAPSLRVIPWNLPYN
jgi:hypothetical protein